MEQKDLISFKEDSDSVSISFSQKKFATKHLDLFADLFYKCLKKKKKIIFDLSSLEWIAHEELVYISGLLDQLYQNSLNFKIILKNENVSSRQIKTVIYLWENWQLFSFINKNEILKNIDYFFDLNIESEATIKTIQTFFNKTNEEFESFFEHIKYNILQLTNRNPYENKYFDIDINYIRFLKEKLSAIESQEIDNYYHKVTPFVKLNIPNGNFDEGIISNNLNKIYALDEKTLQLLEKCNSNSPFLNKTLSSIITKELYENAIEHAYVNKRINNPSCYLSVSLKNKIYEDGDYDLNKISEINEKNFIEEALPESLKFYKINESYKNQSYIQFTFLDFGFGIPNSLKNEFESKYKDIDDSEVLINAFDYSTSRFPLSKKYLEKNSIPRGLFDVISIVKRYNGLIIIRSNFGKILYDFSSTPNISEIAIKYDNSNTRFFNGTIITILIPENHLEIESKPIKPQYLINATKKNLHYISILEIQKKAIKSLNINQNKEDNKKHIYNETLNDLGEFLDSKQDDNSCIIIDFNGCHLESRISRKIIFFLTSDYRINEKTNALIINPPNKDIILNIQLEILASPEEKQKFIFHPLPCLFQKGLDIEIIWVGISEDTPYQNLNQVLYSTIHDKRLSDFENDQLVLESGFFKLDNFGNIETLIGHIDDLSIFSLAERAAIKKENSVFLCSGNYYQHEYIGLLEQLYDFDYSHFISNLLHKKLEETPIINLSDTTHILAITLSSQLLANAFISQLQDEVKKKIKFVRLSNYHSFFLENEFIQGFKADDKIIVICDVISTGYLIKSLKQKLEAKQAQLTGVISVFDTRNEKNKGSVQMYFEKNISNICLKRTPIDKYKREEIAEINSKNIIRINPATNTPITLEVNKSEINETILMTHERFLSEIDFPENYIKIGYFKYNKLFHPFFFETYKLFQSQNGVNLIELALSEIRKRIDLKIDFVFYPIFSGAEEVHSEKYQDKAFKNLKVEFIPLGRFNTPHGWRFTFPPKLLNSKTLNSDIFIIDDGSCTGSTIIQMIDEISFLDVKSINVLSLVGRTDDYLMEFFSRIKKIKVRHIKDELLNTFSDYSQEQSENVVPLNIFFGSQWQIPTYPLGSNFPFYDEEQLLYHLNTLENLPDILINYVTKRIEKIKLCNIDEVCQLKYLPTDKNNKIPILDLLIIRDHVGKINGYRFYKDYFDFFNDYTELYYKNSLNLEVIKKTELLLSVLLHEPYLIRSIQDFLPDVYSILLKFTQEILENSESSNKQHFENLVLNWNYASFLSIYLNLRISDIKNTMVSKNISHLLDFISKDSTLNSLRIFFMFILNYVPKNKLEMQKQEDGVICLNELSNYIVSLPDNKNIQTLLYSNLKIFKSFLNTIPYLDKELINKKICILKLNQFFNEEKEIKTHDSIEKQLGIIKSQSNSIQFSLDADSQINNIQAIKQAWSLILPRIEQFQRYVYRLKDIFQIYSNGIINNQLFYSNVNLFKICKEINTIIESDNISSNWKVLYDYTKNVLLDNFFTERAFIYSLFIKFKTKNIITIWNSVFQGRINGIIINNEPDELNRIEQLTVYFPLLYLKDVVFKELKKNFRYADINNPINITWKELEVELILNISNKIGNKGKKGGRNGFQMFDILTKHFDFQYDESLSIEGEFLQTYKFKI